MATDPLTAIAALADPARRELYRLLEAGDRPLGRDELAEATGLPRATVAFHLEKLVDAGVLVAEFAHRGDRRGPGSGRPAKFYALAQDELSATVPPRRYDLAAELLATAVERADASGRPVRECLLAVAAEQGEASGDPARPLADTLGDLGYDPVDDDAGGYLLANCPFHRLASRHTDLICSANVAFAGALSEASADHRPVWLEPLAGGCCVRVGPEAGEAEAAG
ncbi:helix-turn-helix transcriptional regulator [Agromyces sp. MMS24-K17]|uniref:helix-turn-helix transcriptional regulator n=1 Tax=Agromyces sp. MMS24-K17 TaxID=3372850 RepID=UPI003754F787